MCAVTHSCACHGAFICVPWHIHVCAMTQSCVCHDSFMCVAVPAAEENVLQCFVVCCGVLRYVAVCCSVLQYVAVCCSMLQCVAVCCSVSQCIAAEDSAIDVCAMTYSYVRHDAFIRLP